MEGFRANWKQWLYEENPRIRVRTPRWDRSLDDTVPLVLGGLAWTQRPQQPRKLKLKAEVIHYSHGERQTMTTCHWLVCFCPYWGPWSVGNKGLWEPESRHRKEDVQERGFPLASEQKFLWQHRLGWMRLLQVRLPPSPLTTHRGERWKSLALGGAGWDG